MYDISFYIISFKQISIIIPNFTNFYNFSIFQSTYYRRYVIIKLIRHQPALSHYGYIINFLLKIPSPLVFFMKKAVKKQLHGYIDEINSKIPNKIAFHGYFREIFPYIPTKSLGTKFENGIIKMPYPNRLKSR